MSVHSGGIVCLSFQPVPVLGSSYRFQYEQAFPTEHRNQLVVLLLLRSAVNLQHLPLGRAGPSHPGFESHDHVAGNGAISILLLQVEACWPGCCERCGDLRIRMRSRVDCKETHEHAEIYRSCIGIAFLALGPVIGTMCGDTRVAIHINFNKSIFPPSSQQRYP